MMAKVTERRGLSIVVGNMASPRLCLALLFTCCTSIHGFTSPLSLAPHSLDRRIGARRHPSASTYYSESSFLSSSSPRSREGGFGGGMGKSKSSSAKNKKQGFSSSSSSTKGGSATVAASKPKTTTTTTPFDVSASVMRHEKRYDQLLLRAAKRMARDDDDDEYEADSDYDSQERTLEFVVASRDGNVLPDWVPVAQLVVAVNDPEIFRTVGGGSHFDDGTIEETRVARAAVSAHCRELHHVAGLASNAFRSIPRQHLRYAIEPAESFYRHVYDKVVDLSPSSSVAMSTVEARKVLQIEEGGTLHDLKLQYRRRSMECHPDRIRHHPPTSSSASPNAEASTGATGAAAEEGASDGDEFSRVKLAYETLLGSGSMRRAGSTWYESLGGRERSDFSAVDLMPLREAADLGFGGVDGNSNNNNNNGPGGVDSAIMGLDPSLVQSFVARSIASK